MNIMILIGLKVEGRHGYCIINGMKHIDLIFLIKIRI